MVRLHDEMSLEHLQMLQVILTSTLELISAMLTASQMCKIYSTFTQIVKYGQLLVQATCEDCQPSQGHSESSQKATRPRTVIISSSFFRRAPPCFSILRSISCMLLLPEQCRCKSLRCWLLWVHKLDDAVLSGEEPVRILASQNACSPLGGKAGHHRRFECPDKHLGAEQQHATHKNSENIQHISY